jgi:hypothetical protein
VSTRKIAEPASDAQLCISLVQHRLSASTRIEEGGYRISPGHDAIWSPRQRIPPLHEVAMLSESQAEAFAQWGFVRLPGAIDMADARAMEDRIWQFLAERFGMQRDDPATWRSHYLSGLQPLKKDPIFAAIGGEATRAGLDAVMGEHRWKTPKNWGQFLVSFPDRSQQWRLPDRVWHTDFGFVAPRDRVFGALLFAFLSEVPERAGGTVIIGGSHRLIADFVADQPAKVLGKMKVCRRAFMRSHPWLEALSSDAPCADRDANFLERDSEVNGARARVFELTGKPGDVILCHPWTMHATAPNCGSSPRFMSVQRIFSGP